MLYGEASMVILAHLRAYRDHLDSLIKYLEEIKVYQEKNSMVVTNPAPNGAAPAAPLGSYMIGSIGGGPVPPAIPVVPKQANEVRSFCGLPETPKAL
jgi:hypothetical protein